jgi:DNA processing protein
MNSLLEWLALSLAPGLGLRGWKKLMGEYGDPGRVLNSSAKELQKRVPGLNSRVYAGIQKDNLKKAAEKELRKADTLQVSIITQMDSSFPDLLRNIHDPPPLLYVKGNPDLISSNCVGMVGARASTTYGQRIASDLSRRLTLRGVTVVSGLALGIDTASHKGALRGSGATVGVLGCGIDVIYPRQNENLYDEIASYGAIVSEYPLGTRPDAFRFPARNRIISGLSLGVIVVEAARKSGSLITADFALEQGREVFAIPGRVDSSKSEGTHRLLQNGAKLVHTIEDIMEELPVFVLSEKQDDKESENGSEANTLSKDEQNLLCFMDIYPQAIDTLIQKSGLLPQKVNELLLTMELKGVVESLAGQQFQLRSQLKI